MLPWGGFVLSTVDSTGSRPTLPRKTRPEQQRNRRGPDAREACPYRNGCGARRAAWRFDLRAAWIKKGGGRRTRGDRGSGRQWVGRGSHPAEQGVVQALEESGGVAGRLASQALDLADGAGGTGVHAGVGCGDG